MKVTPVPRTDPDYTIELTHAELWALRAIIGRTSWVKYRDELRNSGPALNATEFHAMFSAIVNALDA